MVVTNVLHCLGRPLEFSRRSCERSATGAPVRTIVPPPLPRGRGTADNGRDERKGGKKNYGVLCTQTEIGTYCSTIIRLIRQCALSVRGANKGEADGGTDTPYGAIVGTPAAALLNISLYFITYLPSIARMFHAPEVCPISDVVAFSLPTGAERLRFANAIHCLLWPTAANYLPINGRMWLS